MRRSLLLTTILIAATTIFGCAEKVKKDALSQCINDYKSLGISADVALAECKKKSLVACINKFLGERKFVSIGSTIKIDEIREDGKKYLIDRGIKESNWLEGPDWKNRGCTANKNGPSRRVAAVTFAPYLFYYREGWCEKKAIDSGKNYTREEAHEKCDVSYINPTKTYKGAKQ